MTLICHIRQYGQKVRSHVDTLHQSFIKIMQTIRQLQHFIYIQDAAHHHLGLRQNFILEKPIKYYSHQRVLIVKYGENRSSVSKVEVIFYNLRWWLLPSWIFLIRSNLKIRTNSAYRNLLCCQISWKSVEWFKSYSTAILDFVEMSFWTIMSNNTSRRWGNLG
jgi:hypothetical protein